MPFCTMHATDRARQRYDIALTPDIAEGWISTIESSRATLIAGVSRDRKVYDVPHGGKRVRVLYSPGNRKIVTVMRVMKGRI